MHGQQPVASNSDKVSGNYNLDEAVVEVEAEEGGGHARVLVVRLPHAGRHDLLRLRARVVVEVRVQLTRRHGEEERNQRDKGGSGQCTHHFLDLA
jgi:hypothetical protein